MIETKEPDPKFHLGRLLEFNKITTALSAAAFAFANQKYGHPDTMIMKFIALTTYVSLVAASLFGIFIMARSSMIVDGDLTNDKQLKKLGQLYSIFLIFGLAILSIYIGSDIFSTTDVLVGGH